MGAIERFEDIEGWRQARILTKMVYGCTGDGPWMKDFGLRDQIRRAAVSSMSNIAEGFARKGDAEFARFLGIARGSVAEVNSHLYVALDLGYIGQPAFDKVHAQADKTAALIAGLMRYLKG